MISALVPIPLLHPLYFYPYTSIHRDTQKDAWKVGSLVLSYVNPYTSHVKRVRYTGFKI